MDDRLPRYREVRDRALRRRAAAIGALALVPGMTLAACASGDSALEATAADAPQTTTTTLGTTVTDATTTSTTMIDTTTIATGTAIAAGSEMTVAFSYDASSSGGRVQNPYVAVWIEDADGELVQTLSVWWMQGSKGSRWLSDLRRWSTVDGSDDTLDAVSGATRTPGDYALAWDGTDLDGDLVSQGTYYLCIEAAREHGPYSLVREAVAIGDASFTTGLTADGEIAGVQVTFDAA